MKNVMRAVSIVIAASVVTACTSHYKALPAVPEATQVQKLNLGNDAKMVKFTKYVVDIPSGTELGETAFGWTNSCRQQSKIIYQTGAASFEIKPYLEVFNETLSAAGAPVENPIQLFESTENRKADIHVAAAVKDMALNICYPSISKDKKLATGDAYSEIEWSVYSVLDKKVIFTKKTSGKTSGKIESKIGEAGITREAFRAALIQLVNSPEFIESLKPFSNEKDSDAAKQLLIRSAPLSSLKITDNFELVKSSVVTIKSNTGEASGFILSSDGYIVTNTHAVSGSKHVKVQLSTGESYLGKVTTTNSIRDLALVQIDATALRPLPILRNEPQLGSDVYAIGSPLGTTLSSTVTRGIVSAIRKLNDQSYIQSDVSILPGSSGSPLLDTAGNVIGIAVAGISISGAPTGVNFFIPAAEIEEALNIKLK